MSTIYAGSELRPWVVVGETAPGGLIAAPLNDAQGNPKWWTPTVRQRDMAFSGNNKDAQVELAHLWTLPDSLPREGALTATGSDTVFSAIREYFDF